MNGIKEGKLHLGSVPGSSYKFMWVVDLNMCGDEADRTGWLLFELYPLKSYLSKLGQVKESPVTRGLSEF